MTVDEQIKQILDEIGWPEGARDIFRGDNLTVESRRFPEGYRLFDALTEEDEA